MPLCFRTCTHRAILEVPRAITVRAFMYRAFLEEKLELEPLSLNRTVYTISCEHL